MKELLENILSECSRYTREGTVATYIPELAKAYRDALGIFVITNDGKHHFAGDYEKPFTLQSVVKPVILLLALEDRGEGYVSRLCGVEATGKPFDAFNYSDRALTSEHINPMINAGAIALCTLIKGNGCEEKFSRLLELLRVLELLSKRIGLNIF